MHRVIRDHLEEVLASQTECDRQVVAHINECHECRDEVETMRAQARSLQRLRADAEPRPGFYARVLERIEKEGPVSIWYVFSESAFGRRIALASMALVVLAGIFLYTSEPREPEQTAANPTVLISPDMVETRLGTVDQDAMNLVSGAPDRDTVLVNLVTYREQ